MTTAQHKRSLPILLLLLVWICWWWPVIANHSQVFFRDLTFYALPMKAYWVERISHGQLPFWTPYASSGMPFLAELTNQVFYPLNVIFLFFTNLVQGLSWFVIVHHLGAMAAAYILARRSLQLSRLHSVWVALVYSLSGYVVSIADNVNYMPVMIWGPWTLHSLWQWWQRTQANQPSQWRYLAAAALGLVFLFFAGDLFNPTLIALWLLLYAPWACKKNKVLWLRYGLGCLAIGLLAAMVAGVQLIPSIELLQHSVRQQDLPYTEMTTWSFPPQRLIEWVVPFFYGKTFPAPTFIGQFMYPEFRQPWAESVYIGLLPVALALVAIWRNPSAATRGRALFFGGIGLFALVISFGHFWDSLSYPLFELFWPLKHHRYLEKAMFWPLFSLAMLAGLGLAQSMHWLTESQIKASLGSRLALIAGILGVLWLFLLYVPSQAWITPHQFEASHDWYGRFIFRQEHVTALFWATAWRWGSVLLILLLPFHQAIRPWRQHLLLAVVILDLGITHFRHWPLMPNVLTPQHATRQAVHAQLLAPLSPQANNPVLVEIMRQHTQAAQANAPSRMLYDDWADFMEHPNIASVRRSLFAAYGKSDEDDPYHLLWPYRVLGARFRLLFNIGLLNGLQYHNGRYAPMQPGLHKQTDDAMLVNFPALWMQINAVPWVVSSLQPRNTSWDATPQLIKTIWQDPLQNIRLLRVTQPHPLVAWADTWAWASNPTEALNQLVTRYAKTGMPASHVMLEAGSNPKPEALAARTALPRVHMLLTEPERISVQVGPSGKTGALVLAVSDFPGWQAQLNNNDNGTNLPIYRANGRQQAVFLPPQTQTSTVTWHYQPTYWPQALALSIIGLLLLSGALVYRHKQQVELVQ